jgi:hypothetical protein
VTVDDAPDVLDDEPLGGVPPVAPAPPVPAEVAVELAFVDPPPAAGVVVAGAGALAARVTVTVVLPVAAGRACAGTACRWPDPLVGAR